MIYFYLLCFHSILLNNEACATKNSAAAVAELRENELLVLLKGR
jgi:hypothetical protein